MPPTPRTGAHTPLEIDNGSDTGRTLVTEKMGTPAVEKLAIDPIAKEATFKLAEPSKTGSLMSRMGLGRQRSVEQGEEHVKVKLSITDVNPLPPMWAVLKKPNNLLAVFCSGGSFEA